MKVPLIMPKRDVSQTAVALLKACNLHLIIINDGFTDKSDYTFET